MQSLRRHAGRALIALMIAAGAVGVVAAGTTGHPSPTATSVQADGHSDGGASTFGNIDWP